MKWACFWVQAVICVGLRSCGPSEDTAHKDRGRALQRILDRVLRFVVGIAANRHIHVRITRGMQEIMVCRIRIFRILCVLKTKYYILYTLYGGS